MSLTSELNNSNSLIYQYFHKNFMMDNFLQETNESIKDAYTIKPENKYQYPWADIGHITEYLMLLHIGLSFKELFPIRLGQSHIKSPSLNTFLKGLTIKYEVIQPYLSNKESFTELSNDLYKLSKVEGLIRGNNKFTFSELLSYSLNKNMVNDLLHLYFESLKVNDIINSKNPYVYNPTFFLSNEIKGADADLYFKYPKGNYLLDLKTTIYPKITKDMMNQLLGYSFLDSINEHKLTDIGIYLTRQNLVSKWNISELITQYSSFNSYQEAQASFISTLKSNSIKNKM